MKLMVERLEQVSWLRIKKRKGGPKSDRPSSLTKSGRLAHVHTDTEGEMVKGRGPHLWGGSGGGCIQLSNPGGEAGAKVKREKLN